MRGKKILWILCTCAILVAVAAATLMLLGYSEIGSRITTKAFATLWHDRISIGEVHGTWSSGVDISNLLMRNEGIQMHVRQAHVNLDPKDWLRGNPIIERLNLKGIILTFPSDQAIFPNIAAKAPQVLSYPKPFLIKEVVMEDVTAKHAESEYHFSELNLTVRGDIEGLHIESLKIRTDRIALSLLGEVTLHPDLKMAGSLIWSATLPNQLDSRGRCNLNGDIRKMELTVSAASPLAFETRIDLTVDESWKQCTLIGKPIKRAGPSSKDMQPPVSEENRETIRGVESIAETGFCSNASTCLSIKDLQVETLNGEVRIVGAVQLLPQKIWSLTLDAYGIDPGRKWSALNGKIDLHATVLGKLVQDTPVVRMKDIALSGELFEQPVQVSGDFELPENGWPSTAGLLVQSGDNRIELKGDPGSSSALSFTANLANPEPLWPGLKGNLQASGRIKAEGRKLHGEVAFEGHKAGYGAFESERIVGSLSYDSENGPATQGSLAVTRLRAQHELFSKLELAWKGDLVQHEATFKAESSAVRADLALQGQCDGKTWQAVVSKASLKNTDAGTWQLANPVRLVLTHTEMKPMEACWARNGKTACANAAWKNDTGWTTGGDLDKAPIDSIAEWIHMLPDSPYGKLMGSR